MLVSKERLLFPEMVYVRCFPFIAILNTTTFFEGSTDRILEHGSYFSERLEGAYCDNSHDGGTAMGNIWGTQYAIQSQNIQFIRIIIIITSLKKTTHCPPPLFTSPMILRRMTLHSTIIINNLPFLRLLSLLLLTLTTSFQPCKRLSMSLRIEPLLLLLLLLLLNRSLSRRRRRQLKLDHIVKRARQPLLLTSLSRRRRRRLMTHLVPIHRNFASCFRLLFATAVSSQIPVSLPVPLPAHGLRIMVLCSCRFGPVLFRGYGNRGIERSCQMGVSRDCFSGRGRMVLLGLLRGTRTGAAHCCCC